MSAEAMILSRVYRQVLSVVFGVVVSSGGLGCVHELSDEPVFLDHEPEGLPLMSTRIAGVVVNASYRWVPDGTPTYGYDPRAPRLDVEVTVSDAQIAAVLPGFDGMERAFVFVPRSNGNGGARWELHGLSWSGPAYRNVSQDLYNQRTEVVGDKHRLDGLRLTEADLEQVLLHGVAVGFDTNRGTLWAQDADQNFPVEEARLPPR